MLSAHRGVYELFAREQQGRGRRGRGAGEVFAFGGVFRFFADPIEPVCTYRYLSSRHTVIGSVPP